MNGLQQNVANQSIILYHFQAVEQDEKKRRFRDFIPVSIFT
jgi:hypothetical protein